MARFTSTNRSHDGPRGGIFAYLASRGIIESPQKPSRSGPRSRLLSLPMELVQIIIQLATDDKKTIQNVRLVCKLFNRLNEDRFHRAYLTELRVAPTSTAFTRLLWTARLPELSHTVQSITILYDNDNFVESGPLCSGMYKEGKVDLLLETLAHFHRVGRSVDLNVTVAKTPLDATSSVIGILYRVLGYVLFGCPEYDQPGVRNIFLDIDDTSSAALPILTDPSEHRDLAEDYGPRFQDIWTRMSEIGTLELVQLRFSKKGEETQPHRHLTFQQRYGRIDVGMQNLGTWHFDIMGRMTIFSDIFYMGIKNFALEISKEADWFHHSRLQHLILRNVSVHDTHRLFNPPRIIQAPAYWEDTLLHLAVSALPNEVLLHIATYLPPSKILRLRLVNKHLCAAIEKAFNALCLAEVTFPLISSGLRSLLRFSRSSLAAHVKVLLLKVDGVYTHLQIKSVRNQIYLSDAFALLHRRHVSLSVGVKYDPKGTVIGELRNPGVKMAVMTNIKHVFTKFLLPTVAASGITISTLYFDVQSESLHDEGLRASNPMISWLHVSCVASAAVTWDILLRYQHSKDNTTPSNYIHFARGATLTVNNYTSACYTDTLPFLITNDYSTLVIDNGKIPQPGDRFLGGPYAMSTTSLHITDLELVGPHADHCTYILNLQKRNINNNHVAVSCQIRMLSRCKRAVWERAVPFERRRKKKDSRMMVDETNDKQKS
ncbi:hypothetical protein KCU71_g1318, partial [Aureobasidium melanogenum]